MILAVVRLLEDVSRWVSWECLWIICLEVRSTHSLSLSGWVLRIGIMWKLRHYYCYFVHPHLCKLWENIRGGGREMTRDDLLVCLQSRWDIRMNFEGISPFLRLKINWLKVNILHYVLWLLNLPDQGEYIIVFNSTKHQKPLKFKFKVSHIFGSLKFLKARKTILNIYSLIVSYLTLLKFSIKSR